MTPAEESWRLTIVGAGSGFAVTATRGLTCAHVIGESRTCEVRSLGERPVRPTGGWPADDRADIAVVDITGHSGELAPMAPRSAPRTGSTVRLLGLPRNARDDFGRWAKARVSGTDPSGRWLQMDPLDGWTSQIDKGFSGGAVVEEETGCVIGMVVASVPGTAAWMIPLATLVDHEPWLAGTFGDPLRTDPDFVRFLGQLALGRYPEALDTLRVVEGRQRQSSDTYYYWALTMLGGRRPAMHSAMAVEAVERVLNAALRRAPGSPHAGALLALVYEDYYVRGHMPGPRPDLSGIGQVSTTHAEEIRRHVPARECRVWQLLNRY
ncbi:trypsin-like peptidase domain-containing protein [Actinoplanes sp. NPDC051343]|uniref:trypsin-like peptidase domain-containing protein n=1 Tax=Actinoplanes sp. NPDC051343 TaxID=3363906 RepID=UPI0037A8854D